MKPIEKDEIYQHLSNFLSSKGIDLKQGTYTHGIQKGCGLLTEAINLSQTGIRKAKVQVDQKLDQMRQVIHEKTAPKPQAAGPKPPATSGSTAGDPIRAASAPTAAEVKSEPAAEPLSGRKRTAKPKARKSSKK